LANIGAYGLLRFGGAILPAELELSATALIVIGTVSIAYGALQAIARRDTREVLAYSSIGHAGYVLVALGLGGPIGLAAAVIFSVANALSKTLLFLAAELRGRLVATAFLLGALSVAGVPPSAGFFGKAALFEAGIAAGSAITVVLLSSAARSRSSTCSRSTSTIAGNLVRSANGRCPASPPVRASAR